MRRQRDGELCSGVQGQGSGLRRHRRHATHQSQRGGAGVPTVTDLVEQHSHIPVMAVDTAVTTSMLVSLYSRE